MSDSSDAPLGVEPAIGSPTKVCPRCSVQTSTSGDFCPHCGASYVARRRGPRAKAFIVGSVILVLVAVVTVGVLLKIQHDRSERRVATEAADRAADKADRVAEEKAAQAALDAQAEKDEEERTQRTSLIMQMQRSITKDAKEKVADGILDGPIFYTSCDPLGGGSIDDLTALTTTFECLAVNEKLDGGQVRGWVFSATMNWDEATWTWRLGG